MKSIILLLLFSLPFVSGLLAQEKLDAAISFATFKKEDTTGGYVEVYLHVSGQTVQFAPLTDGTVQAVVNVVILFRQGADIIKFDKYRLNSPALKAAGDFVDVKRYALENGHYDIEVSVEDTRQENHAQRYASAFDMQYEAEAFSISDLQLVASYQPASPNAANNAMIKSGFVLEPLPSGFYDKGDGSLIFYGEIYNADKAIGSAYQLTCYLDNTDTKERVESILTIHKRKTPEPVTAVLQQLDITSLPSGNYALVLEVRNREQELLARKSVLFQRSNPYLNATQEEIASAPLTLEEEFVGRLSTDELEYSLRAIAMQVDKNDGEHLNLLIKEKKPEAMRLYLFSYWAKENPTYPAAAYEAYMEVARKVDDKFQSGFGHGFETDRGYVFMKYGAPSDVVPVEDDPSAPPYEIWFYNQFPTTNQNNVKFMFYNPSLASNGHILLHSTARGEVNNPRWEVELYRDAPAELDGNDYINDTRMKSNTGRHARRLFESY